MTHRIQRTWIEPAACDVDKACLDACGDDALLAAILARRGFNDPQRIRAYFSPDHYSPCPPERLPDLVTASSLLHDAIVSGKRILIWGDFDVDGQTSTALLVDGLARLGADVCFYIPDRTIDSHGIKVASLEQQIEAHGPGVLVTCDTGISEYAALDYAKSVGLPVIITDHHEIGNKLPDAAAIVNPRRLPDTHPLTSLPGVGVAFKLMQHLYTDLGRERELPRLLDLVALGIVGDVATQTDDTRFLLQLGLERLRRTERQGLLALIEIANLAAATLTGERIAYQIGPRLNAAGRLADAALSVELLTTHNSSRARVLAQQLEGLNNERRAQTRRIEVAAEELIAATPSLLDYAGLVLYHPDWHAGIIGIVASHLAERYSRPVVMLGGQEGGIARGSARSPRGHDMNKALTAQADLLRTFGGHPGAAGLSLEVRSIDEFRRRFSETLAESGIKSESVLAIDAITAFDDLTLDLATRIQRLAPFGSGNPPVTLATMGVQLSHAALIGREQLHRRLTVEDSQGHQQILLWWHSASEGLPDGVFDVAYNVSINERQELQLALIDYRIREAAAPEVLPIVAELIDWRQEIEPLVRLEKLCAEFPDSLIWAEAFSRNDHPNWKRRAELIPASTLIIFTAPCDPRTLHDVAKQVQPTTIHVFGVQPPIESVTAFLGLLERAAQNVIDHLGGKAPIELLGGATAASPKLVRAGLEYLASKGNIGAVSWPNKSQVKIIADIAQPDQNMTIAKMARVVALFEEEQAYRRYFHNVPLDRLLSR